MTSTLELKVSDRRTVARLRSSANETQRGDQKQRRKYDACWLALTGSLLIGLSILMACSHRSHTSISTTAPSTDDGLAWDSGCWDEQTWR